MIFIVGIVFLITVFFALAEAYYERDIPRRTIIFVIVMAIALLCSVGAQAQNSRYDYFAATTTGSGNLLPLLVIPGATVNFYTGCTSLPCSTYANVYNSVSGATACPTTAQIVLNDTSACVAMADGEGNFGGWFLPGQYQYTITAFSATYGPYSFTIGYNSGSFSFPISIGNGGTGQTTAAAALAALGGFPLSSLPVSIANGGTGQATGIAALNSLGIANGTTPIAFGNPFTDKIIQSVYNADQYCTTAGTYDQSCLINALASSGNNSVIKLANHTYNFASLAVLSNLSNVSIVGDGPGTIITGNYPTYGEYVIQCTNCSNFKIKNLQFKSNITPTLVASSQLPSASTYIVLERNGAGAQTPVTAYTITSNIVCFTGSNSYTAGQAVFLNGFQTGTFLNFTNFVVQSSGLSSTQFCGSSPFFTHANTSLSETGFSQLGSGTGYMPSVNDGDVVPTASGGSCTANCLTTTQSTEAFDAGLQCLGCSNVEITGVTGNYYTLTFYGGNNVNIHDNQIAGGTGFGCVGFWPSITITGTTQYTNNYISVHNNIISACSSSGVELANTQHFSVANNVISNIGESGVKTWQDFSSNHYASWTAVDGAVTGNVVTGTWYDALDISFDLLATALPRHISITGNHLDYNRGTQTISDGLDMTYVGNEGYGNGADGQLAYCNSTITGNSFSHNASLYPTVGGYGSELTLVPSGLCGDNIVASNITNTGGIPGVVGILDNSISSIASYFYGNFEATGTNNISSNNFQSGNVTGSTIGPVQGLGFTFLGAAVTNMVGSSTAGNYSLTLPAANGTVAITPGTQAWGYTTLSAGSITVSTSAACTAGASCIYTLTNCGSNGSTGIGVLLYVSSVPGTSFTIGSASSTNGGVSTDNSHVCWKIN